MSVLFSKIRVSAKNILGLKQDSLRIIQFYKLKQYGAPHQKYGK